MNLRFFIKVLQVTTSFCSVVIATDNENKSGLMLNINNDEVLNDDKCPPCFNCMLPLYECKQFSKCNTFSGRCDCLPGFGEDDCSKPTCGGLADGKKRFTRDRNQTCICKDGWGGINCNICQRDSVCDSFIPDGLKGTCYKDGMIVKKVHQGCNVTNEKIIEILRGSIPYTTFSCDKDSQECNFQFWIDEVESFYCGLEECEFNYELERNTTHYTCKKAKCKCMEGEMLCGKGGSIDISDFLVEMIKGPGDFTCNVETRKCQFSEPKMNDLIQSVFGDPFIFLECNSGECVHYSQIPGYHSPGKGKFSVIQVLNIMTTSLVFGIVAGLSAYLISKTPLFGNAGIELEDENDQDIEDFLKSNTKASLTFENIKYSIPAGEKKSDTLILDGINGYVAPGEILAIIGSSGAGKTCLLDILAMKNKKGTVSGTIKVNGKTINRSDYQKIFGFIDQKDFLLPTLTVYETILNSALLRLPRSMSFAAKKKRVYEVMDELRIFEIRDRLIGDDFKRGISGGEKRRVSIACELVTSPLILFLDEPTSGLDSNNANNVIDCLVKLAIHYNRTLVLSIHQPRSNIFKLFDKLLVLSHGEIFYSGEAARAGEYLRNNNYECPADYNITDYMIDLTLEPTKYSQSTPDSHLDIESMPVHKEHSLHVPEHVESSTQREWEHFALHRDELRGMLLGSDISGNHMNSADYKYFSDLFYKSSYATELTLKIKSLNSEMLSKNIALPNSHASAGFLQQISILNSRNFKNICRNPKLLLTNYVSSILLGLFLGSLYYDVGNDIGGLQNRIGLFLFVLTYFGFLTFTGLSSFSIERIIFTKERANHCYSPAAYYTSKIISDVLPLRSVPPILFCIVLYPLVRLNMVDNAFYRCMAILVLFNVCISVEVLSIGIIFEDLNTSLFIGVMLMLFSLLFSGLFINMKEFSYRFLRYVKNTSIFYYSYEALVINEVKTLILSEHKYGLNVEIPGATILSLFGFTVQNMNFDIKVLACFCLLFMFLGYSILELFVVECK